MIMSPSSRWSPTPEQLMMLEEIYRGGIKTPNATQIQKITAQLSLYGKIEGKNVFYWFQNHKARDRQKLRRKLLLTQQLIYQQQQQLLYNPPNYHHHFLHHLPSSPAPRRHSLQVGGRRISVEDTSTTRGMSYKWKGDVSEKSKIHDDSSSLMTNKTRNDDWKMIMMDVCASPAPPPPRFDKRPLKTLQLFPITSTASTIETSPSPSPASPISSVFHLDL